MDALPVVVLTLLMAAVLGVLLAGVAGMLGGSGGAGRSNRLMRWRVVLQFAAVLALALVVMTA